MITIHQLKRCQDEVETFSRIAKIPQESLRLSVVENDSFLELDFFDDPSQGKHTGSKHRLIQQTTAREFLARIHSMSMGLMASEYWRKG